MLVKSQDIAECYIKSMIDTVKKSGSYMVIDEGIALIHGEIDYGVNQTSMSLLKTNVLSHYFLYSIKIC